MTSEDRPEEVTDAQLQEWWRAHNGRDADGQPAGIGVQARDRLIRRLIDEVHRLRTVLVRRPP